MLATIQVSITTDMVLSKGYSHDTETTFVLKKVLSKEGGGGWGGGGGGGGGGRAGSCHLHTFLYIFYMIPK